MLARLFRDATFGVLACSMLASAQDTPPATPPAPAPTNPPQGAPPATPPAAQQQAPQGAPRQTSTVKVGAASITVEHGQPPWSDDRIGQMAQLPVGQVWRMGSEGMTTIVVAGGPVFFGEELIEPGRYGFNLVHAGENAWNFIVFEPIHEATNPLQMMGDEPNHLIVSKFVGDAKESAPALTIDFTGSGDTATCELKWGPMRVTAPLTGIVVTRSDLELNGNPATASWFSRPLAADLDPSKPVIAGTIDLEIEEEPCSMNVYVMVDGGNLVTLFRNQERERWEKENAAMDDQEKRLNALIQQFGAQAEGQINPILQQMRRKRAKNEVYLEDSVTRPDNLKFSAPAEEATPGKVSCDVFKTRSGRSLEIIFGGKKAVIRIDDSQFALKPAG
jgi:hypothetical protein